jgi:hypothetical protein
MTGKKPSSAAGTCARCGATADPKPPTWTLQTGERGEEWLCDACTRDNIRSIEGRLDATWW